MSVVILLLYFIIIIVKRPFLFRVTGGELFEDIVAREYYSEADARYSFETIMIYNITKFATIF